VEIVSWLEGKDDNTNSFHGFRYEDGAIFDCKYANDVVELRQVVYNRVNEPPLMFAVEPARLAPFFHLTRKLRDPSDGRRKAKLLWKPTLSARPLSGQESKAEPGSAHIKITFPLLHGFPLPPRKKM